MNIKTPRRLRKPRRCRTRKLPTVGKTLDQFRADWGISRSGWYAREQRGLNPKTFQPGGKGGLITILPADEAAWVRRFMKRPAAAARPANAPEPITEPA